MNTLSHEWEPYLDTPDALDNWCRICNRTRAEHEPRTTPDWFQLTRHVPRHLYNSAPYRAALAAIESRGESHPTEKRAQS